MVLGQGYYLSNRYPAVLGGLFLVYFNVQLRHTGPERISNGGPIRVHSFGVGFRFVLTYIVFIEEATEVQYPGHARKGGGPSCQEISFNGFSLGSHVQFLWYVRCALRAEVSAFSLAGYEQHTPDKLCGEMDLLYAGSRDSVRGESQANKLYTEFTPMTPKIGP